MHTSRRLAVVLAVVTVTAGCGTPLVDSGPSSPTEPVTPAPLPEGTPEPVAPGVTAAGVADATALKDAHVAQLRGGNFSVRRERVERFSNGSLRSRTGSTAAFPGDGRYHVERTFEGPVHDRLGTGGTVRQYGDDDGTVRVRLAANGTVLSRTVAGPPGGRVPKTALVSDPYSGRTVLLVLRGVAIDRVTELDGRSAYRLTGSGIADLAALRSLLSPTLMRSIRDVAAAATVTEAGLVRQLLFTYTVDLRGGPVRVTRVIEFTDVGTTTLARPTWADVALASEDATTENVTTESAATAT